MKLLPEPLNFLWDDGNIDKNLKKHKVTTQEAEVLFSNEPFTARYDARHGGAKEARYQALGKSRSGRKLFVAFTIRLNSVRVISIRDMTEREEKAYEQAEENS